jgi:hypothetical protein
MSASAGPAIADWLGKAAIGRATRTLAAAPGAHKPAAAAAAPALTCPGDGSRFRSYALTGKVRLSVYVSGIPAGWVLGQGGNDQQG